MRGGVSSSKPRAGATTHTTCLLGSGEWPVLPPGFLARLLVSSHPDPLGWMLAGLRWAGVHLPKVINK